MMEQASIWMRRGEREKVVIKYHSMHACVQLAKPVYLSQFRSILCQIRPPPTRTTTTTQTSSRV